MGQKNDKVQSDIKNTKNAIWIDYDGKTNDNYNTAIDYYEQITNNYLQALLNRFKHFFMKQNIKTTEDLIKEMSKGLDPFINNWQEFYNNKPSIQQMQSLAQQYCNTVNESTEQYAQSAARAKLLIDLMKANSIINESFSNSLPDTLDFSSIETDLISMATKSTLSNEQLIGHRTNIMSEIFEQGGRYFANTIGNLMNFLTVGTGRILNEGGKQIKPDSIITYNATIRNSLKTGTSINDLPAKIDLALNEIINLNDYKDNINGLIQDIGVTNQALGATMKMWTSKARHKTMGYFLSGGDIDRDKIHSDPNTRRMYNAYAHSKYLINIIGALNGLIVGGANGLSRTDVYLRGLMNSNKGIMAANDTLSKKTGLEIKPRYTRSIKRSMRAST
jgi:hypothetical protein